MSDGPIGEELPSANGKIDIRGIQFDPIAGSAGAFGSHKCRATADKGIQHDIASRRAVQNGVSHQVDGFYGGVKLDQFCFVSLDAAWSYARMHPHVCSVTAELT